MILFFAFKGGDVNVVDGERHTPIHVAAHTGHAAILTFLTQVMMKIIMMIVMIVMMMIVVIVMMMMTGDLMHIHNSRHSATPFFTCISECS